MHVIPVEERCGAYVTDILGASPRYDKRCIPFFASLAANHSPYNAATRSSISFSHARQPIPWASRHFWDNADIADVPPGARRE